MRYKYCKSSFTKARMDALITFAWICSYKYLHHFYCRDVSVRFHLGPLFQPVSFSAPWQQGLRMHCSLGVMLVGRFSNRKGKGIIWLLYASYSVFGWWMWWTCSLPRHVFCCLLLALSLVVKLVWVPLWILNKAVLLSAVWLPIWPAAVAGICVPGGKQCWGTVWSCCLKKYSLESNWLWKYINIFCWREVSSNLSVVSLPLNLPISLVAPNLEANENYKTEKFLCLENSDSQLSRKTS